MIRVVLNADDFGYSKVFNTRILDLLEKDVIRSTTVLIGRVDESQNEQIGALIGLHNARGIGVGIEIELENDKDATRQMAEQYKKFLDGFGFEPSHFNIHLPKKLIDLPNSREVIAKIGGIVAEFANAKGIPINHDEEYGIKDWHSFKTTTQPLFVGTKKEFEISWAISRACRTEKPMRQYSIPENTTRRAHPA